MNPFEIEYKLSEIEGMLYYNKDSVTRVDLFKGKNVPSKNFSFADKMRAVTTIYPSILKIYFGFRKSIYSLRDNPEESKIRANPELFSELEKEARRLGGSDIGYTRVPRDAIFKDKTIMYENAIMVTGPMDRKKISTSPSFPSMVTIMKTYADLGSLVNKLAVFLRNKGYGAHAGIALGGLSFYPRLAQDSGMGLRGLNGLLISPGHGPCQRIAAVYTSIKNLPISKDNPHKWILDFCKNCRRCIKKCPVGAIFKEPKLRGNGQKVYIDSSKCMPYFARNYGCSICIKECPFFYIGYDRVKEKWK